MNSFTTIYTHILSYVFIYHHIHWYTFIRFHMHSYTIIELHTFSYKDFMRLIDLVNTAFSTSSVISPVSHSHGCTRSWLRCIFSMKRRSERKVQRRPNFEQNRRLIQSLLTVIVVFWLTWLPFTICTIRWIYPCKVRRCRRCPLLSLNFLKVLHYSNSFANPIIYAIGLLCFRSTIKQTFCKRKRAML